MKKHEIYLVQLLRIVDIGMKSRINGEICVFLPLVLSLELRIATRVVITEET